MLGTASSATQLLLLLSWTAAFTNASRGHELGDRPAPARQEPGFFTNDRAPSLPLAVKSPYLSAWLPVGSSEPKLAGTWPQFWTGQSMGWTGFIHVAGEAYTFLGDPIDYGQHAATQTFYKFSATRTVFGFDAGPISFNVTFLTPVFPDDPVKQSLPFSYMEVSVASKSGTELEVDVYTDIAGDWLSSDLNTPIFWKTRHQNGLVWHEAEAFAPQVFDEYEEHIMHGKIVLATDSTQNISVQTGGHHRVRESFVKNGRLDYQEDTKYRRIGDDYPTFALAKSLKVGKQAERALFAIGHIRNPAISYRATILEEPQSLSLLYLSKYATWQDALLDFFVSFPATYKHSVELDLKTYEDAARVSRSYAKICALSLRQAFAAVELTGTHSGDIRAWMKEISSDGNLNTVDVIYPAMPLFLYLAPQYIGWLIEPILRYQSAGAYYESGTHDLGSHYPYATGPSDGAQSHMPVEESGNILLIALAHAQATGDISLVGKYYKLFERWTIYLMRKALIPESQLSTDDFMGPITNSTSLALKGGIGIFAMGDIADLLGHDGARYHAAARSYIKAWHKLASAHEGPKRLLLSYHLKGSYMLAYNLFAEKLLGIELIPQSVYEEQDRFYPLEKHRYGVPLDSRRTQTKTDWLIWTAASTTNVTVSKMLVDSVTAFLDSGKSDAPFSDWYDTETGESPGFRARPVVGGHFAFLALEKMEQIRASAGLARQQAEFVFHADQTVA